MSSAVASRLRLLLASWLVLGVSVACGQQAPYFDGRKAFRLLERQVALGPRQPGSEGHAAMVRFLQEFLEPLADEVILQRVSMPHPYRNGPLHITNVVARFNASARSHLLLLAHYDTRALADQDDDPANRNLPILGANDGASGVAVLLTLAQIMDQDTPPVGVDLLFVDAEDVGRSGDVANFGLGAKAFVPEMARLLGGALPRYAVLLDMVGDAELTLPMEYHSWRDARSIVQRIWSLAAELGYTQFQARVGPAIYDDHMPFLEAGIPTVDIIDFDYPNTQTNYWHTLQDTPDKCSPESLEAVGTVVTTLVYSERP